jgi:hypothetical protein
MALSSLLRALFAVVVLLAGLTACTSSGSAPSGGPSGTNSAPPLASASASAPSPTLPSPPPEATKTPHVTQAPQPNRATPATQAPVTTSAPVAPVTTAGCYPISDEGTCYEPGEYCRDDDHGMTGRAGDGKTIECEDNDGWRWEPV